MNMLKPVGFFKSNCLSQIGGMSLRELISSHAHPNEESIIKYLSNGLCVAASGGYAPDYLDLSLPIGLQMDILSDGEWQWPSYLVYYVETYHLQLPSDFVDHMKSNNWIVPDFDLSTVDGRVFYV